VTHWRPSVSRQFSRLPPERGTTRASSGLWLAELASDKVLQRRLPRQRSSTIATGLSSASSSTGTPSPSGSSSAGSFVLSHASPAADSGCNGVSNSFAVISVHLESAAPALRELPAGRPRVLLVEDDPAVRDATRMLLKVKGC
jgi:hypothetical protein